MKKNVYNNFKNDVLGCLGQVQVAYLVIIRHIEREERN